MTQYSKTANKTQVPGPPKSHNNKEGRMCFSHTTLLLRSLAC